MAQKRTPTQEPEKVGIFSRIYRAIRNKPEAKGTGPLSGYSVEELEHPYMLSFRENQFSTTGSRRIPGRVWCVLQ